MSTHNICSLWRSEKKYPRIIIKYCSLTSPLFQASNVLQMIIILLARIEPITAHTKKKQNAKWIVIEGR